MAQEKQEQPQEQQSKEVIKQHNDIIKAFKKKDEKEVEETIKKNALFGLDLIKKYYLEQRSKMKYNFNSPIDNKVLPNKIVDYIRDKIITGELKGGEKVSEAHLSDKLQISRTPIREAIRLLECEGFVEIIPRKGAVVKKFSSEDILNTFEVKAAIEALAVRESVTKFQERDIKKLEQIIENEELYFEKGDIKKVFKEFDNFTTNLIKNCQNELLLDLNKKMTNHIIRYRFFCLKYPEILSNASEYHKKFVDIIKNREFDKIRNEYEKYYMEIGKKMLQKISVL